MKIVFIFLVFILISSCQESSKSVADDYAFITDNEELIQLYNDDQSERRRAIEGDLPWKEVGENDRKRESRVLEMIDSNILRTSNDYRNSAMILHHGIDTLSSHLTIQMMREAIKLDSSIDKWLLAAAIDRDLLKKDLPQIYGTQYARDGEDMPLYRDKMDTTRVTDQERVAFGVETLAEQKIKEKRLNRTNLFDLFKNGTSVNTIVDLCRTEESSNSEYNLSEKDINRFGYQLMSLNKLDDALSIFKLNVELFPNESNAYDGLGECLYNLNNLTESKLAFEKSLDMNPENINAQDYLSSINDMLNME